jgi:hypothetical protein
MMRCGVCNLPMILTWGRSAGRCNALNIYNLASFVRVVPDGAAPTVENSMLNVLSLNMMARSQRNLAHDRLGSKGPKA